MNPRSFVRLYLPTAAGALAVALMLTGCDSQRVAPTAPATWHPTPQGETQLLRAIDAEERAASDLLSIRGVVGLGAALDATGAPEIVALIERAGVTGLPARVDGIRVERLIVGTVQPFALSGTYRPLAIGVSVGSANECLPGTIGCVLERGNDRFLLSANHVFARQNRAALGETIVQPSLPDLDPACGPAPASAAVATLADFEPVVYDGKTPNRMDAAIARVTLPRSQVDCATPSGFYGTPSATITVATDRTPIMKLGRTTELTRGQVKAVNVKVKITFPAGTALFVDQVLTSPGFGAFGDSGALAVTDDGTNEPVGIVIGGSQNGSAILSPVGPILERFGATICTR